jgi:membrane protease YdiL (CAAX protease family)
MNNATISAKAPKNVTAFFVLTFVLTIPIYILAIFVPAMEAATSFLFVFIPLISALVLAFRENGSDGAKKLIKRSFDFKKITRKMWYVPLVFMMPFVFLVVFWILGFIGDVLPETIFPLSMAPILLIMFFFMALGEEIGWMGYAYDPMEERWNASRASLILGIIWFTWLTPFYIVVAGNTLLWAAGALVLMIGVRILLSWIFNNTGKSIFSAILFHAIFNVSVTVLPGYTSPLGPVIAAVLVIIILVIITRVWDPQTLTQLRRDQVEDVN